MTRWLNKILLGDCLDVMREMPDKCVDLVLTDPPYGLGRKLTSGGTWATNSLYDEDSVVAWDLPVNGEYFGEIQRISKNQVIWGGHLYKNSLPISRCWLAWIKINPLNTMGDFELAWTSFDAPCKAFSSLINPNNLKRSHPTQKPVSLFEWILHRYTKPGDIILDPFLGSGTTVAACINLERQYIGIEISPDYVHAAKRRIEKATEQRRLFI